MFINVLGNAIGTIVVGKWENGFDADRAREVLAGRLPFDIEGEDVDDHQPAGDRSTRSAAVSTEKRSYRIRLVLTRRPAAASRCPHPEGNRDAAEKLGRH